VSVAWPVALVPSLMDFVDAQAWRPDFTADDEIVCRWSRHVGLRPIATVPSLCEHEDRQISLLKRRTMNGLDGGRVAACFVGNCDPPIDAREIDWNRVTPALDGGREFLPQVSRAEQR
jgi:hypothetical protein